MDRVSLEARTLGGAYVRIGEVLLELRNKTNPDNFQEFRVETQTNTNNIRWAIALARLGTERDWVDWREFCVAYSNGNPKFIKTASKLGSIARTYLVATARRMTPKARLGITNELLEVFLQKRDRRKHKTHDVTAVDNEKLAVRAKGPAIAGEMHTHMHTHINAHIHLHKHPHTNAHKHTHTHTHTNLHTHTHTHIHTYVHIHMHTRHHHLARWQNQTNTQPTLHRQHGRSGPSQHGSIRHNQLRRGCQGNHRHQTETTCVSHSYINHLPAITI